MLVSEKQVRKTLSYLAQDQLVTRAETQVKVPPNPAANPDDIVQQHTRKKVVRQQPRTHAVLAHALPSPPVSLTQSPLLCVCTVRVP